MDSEKDVRNRVGESETDGKWIIGLGGMESDGRPRIGW